MTCVEIIAEPGGDDSFLGKPAPGPTPPTYQRHGWTDEMVGEAVTWNYSPGNPSLTSMHFYATPASYSWIIFQPDGRSL